ncbi:MAG: FlgD immunoglobulin-like domain containing protein [bacterium]
MKQFYIACLILISGSTIALAQTPAVDIPLKISDGSGGVQVLYFGIDPSATDGIDVSLGESALPPFPPTGVFEARFIGDDIAVPGLGQGSYRDYRPGTIDTEIVRTFELRYQAAGSQAMTIAWNLPKGMSGLLQDLLGGIVVNETMADSGSVTVANPGVIDKLKMAITFPAQQSEISPYTLLAPPDSTLLQFAPNATGSERFVWQETSDGSTQAAAYTFYLDSLNGDFTAPLLSLAADNSGLDTSLTLGYDKLATVLDNLGIAPGDTFTGKWSVSAAIDTQRVFATQAFHISLLRHAGLVVEIPAGIPGPLSPGDTVEAPIMALFDLTGQDIYSIELAVLYDSARLEIISVTGQGTLTSAWGEPVATNSAGKLVLANAGAVALAGSGALLKLRVKLANGFFPAPGEIAELKLQSFRFNEGTPAATTRNGSIVFRKVQAQIFGSVGYFLDNRTIDAVQLNLAGGQSVDTTTDGTGAFAFTGIDAGKDYVLTAAKTQDQTRLEPAISAFDASLVLRNSVGTDTLSPEQIIAADVSGNGEISAFDASIILRYAVGQDVAVHPVNTWMFFAPPLIAGQLPVTSRNYNPLAADMINQDFTGVLIGDVSGNWSAPSTGKTTDAVEIVLGEPGVSADNFLEIPVRTLFMHDFHALALEVQIPKGAYDVETVISIKLRQNRILAWHEKDGKLRIALASAEAFSGTGTQLRILLRNTAPPQPSNGELTVIAYEVDGHRVLQASAGRSLDEASLPSHFSLEHNYPNPFNPGTRITFALPSESKVRLTVYDINGRRIAELINGLQEAGRHEVLWDGKTSEGIDVPSGAYFVRLRAGHLSKSLKVTKIK